jgi:hypothetical protein
MKGRREKEVFSGDGWAQGKGEWDKYGRCILYTYMKIEE